jgi:hypothetical protein
MHSSIVRFIATLADSRVVVNKRKERLSGLLKIYGPRTKTPFKPHCISLQRIVDHLRNEFIRLQAEHNVDLSFNELDVRRAIASFGPAIGTGNKPHVVIRTENRKQFDSARTESQREADRIEQEKFGAEFTMADMPMPEFVLVVDGTLTTV